MVLLRQPVFGIQALNISPEAALIRGIWYNSLRFMRLVQSNYGGKEVLRTREREAGNSSGKHRPSSFRVYRCG